MITEKDKEKILELYKKDFAISHIAKELKISRPTVYDVITDAGNKKQEKKNYSIVFKLISEGKNKNEIIEQTNENPEFIDECFKVYSRNLQEIQEKIRQIQYQIRKKIGALTSEEKANEQRKEEQDLKLLNDYKKRIEIEEQQNKLNQILKYLFFEKLLNT